jgi:hypothetical protein
VSGYLHYRVQERMQAAATGEGAFCGVMCQRTYSEVQGCEVLEVLPPTCPKPACSGVCATGPGAGTFVDKSLLLHRMERGCGLF